MVIFDCDGVLVDSELIANRLLREALEALGMHYTLEETIDRFMGRSATECIEEIERELDGPVTDTFWSDLQQQTYAAFDRELQPVPGVRAVIESLSSAYCVASSGSRDKMYHTLGHTGLLPFFEDRLFSVTDAGVRRGKPFPDLFLHAAASMGVEPAHCIVVEDSVPGVEAGLAAGMTVLGFCRTTPVAKLANQGVVTFTDMSELPDLLAHHG